MASPVIFQRRNLFVGLALLGLVIIYVGRVWFDSLELSLQLVPKPPAVKDEHIVINRSKVAVIIESRPLERIVPLLLHFSGVLGPEWPIFFFTAQRNIPDAAPLLRLMDSGQLVFKALPLNVQFKSRQDVSAFLTQPWIYEQLAPASHMLLFQTDSILCAQSTLRMDDFLQYDFIGAPIAEQYGEGYNGGLSLRNRTMLLDIIRQSDWKAELDSAENKLKPTVQFEDQWFYKKIREYPGSRLPSVDVAKTFSVETIWYDRPLGYHQITRWHKDKLKEVDLWCPEHRLASNELMGS